MNILHLTALPCLVLAVSHLLLRLLPRLGARQTVIAFFCPAHLPSLGLGLILGCALTLEVLGCLTLILLLLH